MKNIFIAFVVLTVGLLGFSTYQGLFVAPTEQTMGDVQRIFYYHVPSAWTAGVCFFVNFLASVVYLWKRNAGSDALAAASAEVGVVFCTIVLITGPIWARPVWGIWWTWDARLTTTLVLWLIYVSYLVLRRFAAGGQTQVLAAALAIFGFVDVPIVYMSIRWFRTQHPSPVMGGGENSGLDPSHAARLFLEPAGVYLRGNRSDGCFVIACSDWKNRWKPHTQPPPCREGHNDRPCRTEGCLHRHLGGSSGISRFPATALPAGARRDEGPEAVAVRRSCGRNLSDRRSLCVYQLVRVRISVVLKPEIEDFVQFRLVFFHWPREFIFSSNRRIAFAQLDADI